ncbi:MAG: hypothetical protein ND807_05995 [Vicinamibacterales bacterium]|nr:hypothetical protein [Vicinamibacterales bacterium]
MSPTLIELKLLPLIALVVGSMIGGGVFNLPSDLSEGASPGAILIGGLITGFGMMMLAFVYQRQAHAERHQRADQVVATLTEVRLNADASVTTRRAAEHYHQQRADDKT